MKTRTDAELEKYISEQKIKDAHRAEVYAERVKKIIDAENHMTEVSNLFLDFLHKNESRIIGKKMYNIDGISKQFAEIIHEFAYPKTGDSIDTFMIKNYNLELRANVWGGSYDDNTYYCDYIRRVMYDVIVCDEKGICLTIRTEPSGLPEYDYDTFVTAKRNINDYQKQIEDLKVIIRLEEYGICQYLRDQRK